MLRPGRRIALGPIVTERQITPGTANQAELWVVRTACLLLALTPLRGSRHASHPDLGDGADVARAALEEGSTNTTTTQEVSQ